MDARAFARRSAIRAGLSSNASARRRGKPAHDHNSPRIGIDLALMSKDQTPAPASPKPEIDAFLQKVRALGATATAGGRGRLIFALDATMSRQPIWDTA